MHTTRKYHQQFSHLFIYLQVSTITCSRYHPQYPYPYFREQITPKITKENYISAIMHEKSCISFSIYGYGNRNVFNYGNRA